MSSLSILLFEGLGLFFFCWGNWNIYFNEDLGLDCEPLCPRPPQKALASIGWALRFRFCLLNLPFVHKGIWNPSTNSLPICSWASLTNITRTWSFSFAFIVIKVLFLDTSRTHTALWLLFGKCHFWTIFFGSSCYLECTFNVAPFQVSLRTPRPSLSMLSHYIPVSKAFR